jgi:hypothetical protein
VVSRHRAVAAVQRRLAGGANHRGAWQHGVSPEVAPSSPRGGLSLEGGSRSPREIPRVLLAVLGDGDGEGSRVPATHGEPLPVSEAATGDARGTTDSRGGQGVCERHAWGSIEGTLRAAQWEVEERE